MLLNQRVGRFAVTDVDRLDPGYLFQFLRSSEAKASFESKAYGSAQPNISPAQILTACLPLPSVLVQRAIAEVLGALNDKIAANTVAAGTADQIAVLRFQSMEADAAITGEASVFSVDQLIRSGDLVMSDGYRTKRSELSRSGYRIIRVADVKAGEIALDSNDFVPEEVTGQG